MFQHSDYAFTNAYQRLATVTLIHTRTVKDLMSTDIVTVGDAMTTDEVARYLIEHEMSGAPVVDEQGHLVGVVSMIDTGRYAAEASAVAPSRTGFARDDASELALEDYGPREI